MARFEMTMAGGERVLIVHPTGGMEELVTELNSNGFLLLSELRSGSSSAAQQVIVASRHITLVRSVDDESRQNTTFRPKR